MAATSAQEPKTARDRLLHSAMQLFYAEGANRVGIDRVIDEANVAKMTLYNHFDSKEALLLCVMEERERALLDAIDALPGTGRAKIEAFFDMARKLVHKPNYRGCPFLRLASDFPDPGDPLNQRAARHKAQVRKRLTAWAKEASYPRPSNLARSLQALHDGLLTQATIGQGKAAARDVHAMLQAVLDHWPDR